MPKMGISHFASVMLNGNCRGKWQTAQIFFSTAYSNIFHRTLKNIRETNSFAKPSFKEDACLFRQS